MWAINKTVCWLSGVDIMDKVVIGSDITIGWIITIGLVIGLVTGAQSEISM